MGELDKRDNRIFVANPNVSGLEREYLLKAFDSGWLSSKGEFVTRFEQDFSSFIGTNFGVSCSSGTAALHLALLASEVTHGDEVIVPDLTFIAPANAVEYCGATPVFVDVSRDNYTIDCEEVEKAITPYTKAVIAVHLYGQVCNMEKLYDICDRHDLILIEDCAESFGSKYKKKYTGSMGDLSTFSFFGNKTITTGEGGMVCANSTGLKDRLMSLRNHCTLPGYNHSGLGYNYRMTNLQAAIGCAQLERANTLISKKRQVAGWYTTGLDSEIKTQPIKESNVPWLYTILLNRRNDFIDYMEDHNIETKPMFLPMSSMEHFYSRQCPNSLWLSQHGVCLPSSTTLTRKEVNYVCYTINGFKDS